MGKRKRWRGGRFELDWCDMYAMAAWRRRKAAKYREMKKCSSKGSSVDRISMLPDEILGLILSHLTVMGRVATSILSRQWRYTWTRTFETRLDFDGADAMEGLDRGEDMWTPAREDKLRLDFVSLVNNALASRKDSDIEVFKVCFNLGKKDEGCIDEWLRYALARKVQMLELNLGVSPIRVDDQCYVFPYRSMIGLNSIHFKQLKTISLVFVCVDGEALEFFLHNCPLLEDLSISHSQELSSLRVIGPIPSLKRLEICWCSGLYALEICDVNLVYFKYMGRRNIPFLLRNLPMLVHISVSKSLFEHMNDSIMQFSSILEQLEILNLDMEWRDIFDLPVVISNLKQLVVVVKYDLERDESLLPLTNLIRSAPRLQKFVVETWRWHSRFRKRRLQRMQIEQNSYPELKEVEFVGFCGVPSDVEFVYHFVDNAAALEKIRIDTTTWDTPHLPKLCYDDNSIYKPFHLRMLKKLVREVPRIKLEYLEPDCINNFDY